MLRKRVSAALSGAAVLLMTLLTACDAASVWKEINDTPVLRPIATKRSEYAIAGPGGNYPCGLGEVDWGFRAFRLEDVPACYDYVPDVAVYCLDGEGNWNDTNVSGLSIDVPSNLVMFNVEQTGLCGIFPAGG